MQAAQRSAVRSLRQVKLQGLKQSRRHASDGHGSSHGHQQAAPASESFGMGFYLGVAAIPLAYLAFKATTNSDKGQQAYFTRYITDKYAEYKIAFERRNDTHTLAMEQAAADRVLFLNEANSSVKHVELRFPEQFNGGSPWNVPAGHGSANIDELVAKYEREASESQKKRLEQLRENKLPAEQTVDPITKLVR